MNNHPLTTPPFYTLLNKATSTRLSKAESFTSDNDSEKYFRHLITIKKLEGVKSSVPPKLCLLQVLPQILVAKMSIQ
jgi:hypothetical protein